VAKLREASLTAIEVLDRYLNVSDDQYLAALKALDEDTVRRLMAEDE
jgi:hypothetical protein